MRARRGVVAALLPALLLVVAGCWSGGGRPGVPVTPPAPFAGCAALTASPAGTPAAAPPSAKPAAKALPDLTLPCFAGGPDVRLDAIRGPAVLNLWAAWCSPCRKELPAFQRLAARTGGTLHVIGVDTRDDRDAAAGLAGDLGVTFPTLVDRNEELRIRAGGRGLPSTILVDASGRISYLHDAGALDDATLAELVRQHLGVRVPS
ncbi:TlpA family protein disulfide reductase [Plantactinospora siamensis]|uniref:TlpA family protein disulfide reductase n=1 Tax=Plantactinospora siamensis TaxID=555372 RepID=A0ABV6P513_9ACTN